MVKVPSPLMIPAGNLSVKDTVGIDINDDDLVEENETITIEASASGLTSASQGLRLLDNNPPTVTLSVSPSTVAEDVTGSVMVTVTAMVEGGVFAEEQTVMVSVGTPLTFRHAQEETDFVAVSDFEITIPRGALSATGTFMLDPINDTLTEGNESVGVLGSLSGSTVTPTEITITEGIIRLRYDHPQVLLREGLGTQSVNFVVDIQDDVATADIPVTVTVTNYGTATSPADYSVSQPTFSLVIRAGMKSVAGTMSISIVDDDIPEGEETISIEVSAQGFENYYRNLDVKILDNDVESGILYLTLDPSSVDEGAGTIDVDFTVLFDAGARTTDTPLTMYIQDGDDDYDVPDGYGGATSPADYSVSQPTFSLVMPAGMTSVTGTVRISIVDDDVAEGDERIWFSVFPTDYTDRSLFSEAAFLTITDNEVGPTDLVLTLNPSSANEDARTVEVIATVTSDVPVYGGTASLIIAPIGVRIAQEGADYTLDGVPSEFMIPDGRTEFVTTFEFEITDDDIPEGDETVTIGVRYNDYYTRSTRSTRRFEIVRTEEFTITDDDTDGPALVLTGSPSRSSEGGRGRDRRNIAITVSLDADSSTADIPVEISVTDGTAEEGADYNVTLVPDALVIPAGDFSVMDNVRIQIIDDNIAEGDETVVIRASAPGLTSASWNFTIKDDDIQSDSLVLTVNPGSLDEGVGGKPLEVKATLNAAASTEDIPVTVSVSDGTATSPADYSVSQPTFSLVIRAGDLSVIQVVPIVIVDDNIAEGDETLSIGAEATGLNSDSEDFTITDDDTPSTDLVVVLSQPSALESAGTATVDVTVSLDAGTRTSDTEVRLTVLDDEATSPADYSVTGSPFTLTIDAGDQSVTQPVPIVIVDDNIAEGDETLSIGAEATGLNSDSEDFTITDDDTPSTDLVVVLSQPSALESAGTATVDVTVSLDAGTRTSDTEVRLTVLDDEATSPADYSVTGSPFTLTIDAGDQSVTQPVPIVIVDDNIAEGDETLSIGAEATGLNSDSEDFTITDDDTPSTDLVVVLSQPSALESAGTATVDVTVSLDAGTRTSDTEVRLTVLDDEATSPADYSVTGSPFTLTIDAGDQSVTQPVPIVIVDDNIAEGDETLSIGAEATGLNSDSEDFTITDDDTPSTDLVVVLSQPSALESAGTATVDVTVSLDAGTRTSDTEVRLTVLDDEATSPADYSVTGSPFTLTIDAGDQSVTQPVPIVIVDDNIAEGDETLSIGAEATGLNSDSEDFTITDDDTPSTDLVVVLSQPSALESAGTATVDVTVSLDAGTRTSDTEVRLTVLDDEATSPADYSVTGSPFTLTIDAGDQSVTQPVPIVIVDDNIAEGDETLSIGAEATGLNSDSEDFTITDDDTPSTDLVVVLSQPSALESAGTATVDVTVSLDAGTRTSDTEVRLTVLDDEATSPADYSVTGSPFTLTIDAGDQSVTQPVPIVIVDDNIAEGDETLSIGAEATGLNSDSEDFTITDDDTPSTDLVVVLSQPSALESAGTATVDVTVSLDAGTRTSDTEVRLTVLDDEATSPADYSVTGSPFTLTIDAGDQSVTQPVPIVIVDDNIAEGDETLSIGAEATGLNSDSEDFTITDDDTPSTDLVVVLSQPSALESAGTATVDVTVSLDAGTRTSDTEVRLTVLDDEATSPADYSVTGSPFTLTIDAGDQSVTQPVPIVIVDDNIAEGDETLSIGAEATGLNSDSEDFTITDDDTPSTDLVVVLSQPSALESAGTATVDVTVSLDAGTRTSDTEVRLTVLDDEATSPADYSVTGSPFTLTIDAGDQSVTQPVPIVIVDDNIAEGDETLSIGAEATGLNSDSEDFTITDDDTPSTDLVVVLSQPSALESAGTATVDVTVSLDAGTRTSDTEVRLTVLDDEATSPADYSVTGSPFTLTIDAGDQSVTQPVPIVIVDDNIAEGDETLSIGAEATGLNSDSEDFTITDDDTPSTDLVVVLSQPSALESAGTATVDVTVSLDAGTRTSDTEVRLTVLDDEATSPADYSVTGSPFTLTIDAGDQSVTQPVPIVIVDDNIAEGDETLSIGAEATGLNSDSEDFTITDDDTPSTDLVVVLSQPSALESAGTATVDVTVSLDAGTRTSDTEVRLTVLDDEATSPADYSVTGSPFTLTIDAGDQSVTQPVPIVIVDDNIAEGDETLSIGAEATGLNSDSEDFTITDDDTPSTDLVVVLSQPSALESAGTATVDVTVSLDAGTRTSDTEVRLTVLDDEATSPADYSVTGSPFTLTIDAGDQSVTQPVPIVIVDDNIAEGDETLSIGAEATGLNSDSEDFTITDDDTPSTDLVVVLSQPSALESAGTATVDVTVSLDAGTRTSDTEVRLTVLDDEATSPADYSVTGSPFTLTIDAGDQSVTQPVPIVIVDDNIAEGDETLSIGAEATGLNSDSEDFTITDDDTPSTDLVVVLSQPSALESAGTATVDVTVSLDAGTRTSDTEVRLTVLDDEATSPADYSVTGSPFTLTIDAGDQSVTQPVPIVIVDDNIAEGDETLSIGAEATGLNSDSEDFTITDDDTPSTDLVVVLSQPSALESAGTATVDVTVSLDAGTRTSDTEVRLTVLDDEATSPADYSVTGSPFTLTIDAGDQSVTQPVPIVIVDDNIAEGDETLSIGAEATGLNSDSEDFTITDDDTPSTDLVVVLSQPSALESAGTATVDVTVSLDAGTRTSDTEVRLTVLDDEATSPADYSVTGSPFTLTIDAGDQSVTQPVPIVIVDDNIAEGDETLSIGAEATGLNSDSEDFTITDDDTPSTDLVVVLSQPSALESAGTATVDVTVSLDAGTRTSDTEVRLTVLDDEATSPADYSVTGSPFTLTIDAGDQSVTQPVPIVIVDDNIAEGDETLSIGAEATGLNSDSEDFTITDDDTPSTDLVVVLSQPSALESAGTATVDVTVSLDAGTRTSDTEVRLTVLDDEATSPADYSVTGSPFTLTIDAGDQSVTQPVPIVIVDDNIAEGDETLSIGAEATGLNSDSEDFTITDDDTPSTDLVVVLSQPSALESAGTATVDVTVSLDAGTRTSDTEVRLTVLDDEATSPADYSVTGSPFTLTIDAGDQSVTQPVPIVIVDDNIAEGDETLSIGAEATGLNSDSEDFTITDDDTPSTDLVVVLSQPSALESAGTATVDVTVSLDAGTRTSDTEVRLTVLDDEATSPADYSVTGSPFTLTIDAGDQSVTQPVPIVIVDDNIAEGDETLSIGAEATGLNSDSEDFTITDDDTPSTDLVVVLSQPSALESAGTATVDVTVSLDAGTRTSDTEVRLTVLDDEATSPADYSVTGSPFTLTIDAGDQSVTQPVPIVIVDDNIAEGDETLSIGAEATGLNSDSEDFTITDDDTPSTDLVVVLSQPSALESAGTATVDVTVSLDAGTRTEATEVRLTVLDDEATSPADYSVTGSPFTLTIDAGDQSVTQPVPIVIVDDNIAEGDETLSIGAEATGLNSDSEDFTITDDDTPSTDLVVVLSQPSALESAGTATVDVTVSLDAGTRTSDTEVRLTVLDDEATSPADYSVTGSPFTLTIDAGDQSVTQPVPIVIVDDNIAEGDETLSIGAEATGLNSDSEDFTITDDDTPSTDLVVVLSQPSALESAGTATVDVTVSLDAGTRTSDTEVRLTVLDDEATSPADYSVTGSPFTLTIDAGDQSVTQPVPIVIVDDNIAEGDETLSIGAEATGLNSDSEDFTITDDDTPSTDLVVVLSQPSALESAGTATVDVTVSLDAGTRTSDTEVRLTVLDDEATSPADYSVTGSPFTLTIDAGDQSVTQPVPIVIVDDNIAEGDETLSIGAEATGLNSDSEDFTITDDDTPSTDLVVVLSQPSALESAGTATVDVTVSLDAGTRTSDTEVRLTVLDDEATSPADYSVTGSPFTLTIDAGDQSVTQPVPIVIVDDNIAEGDETLSIGAEATGLNSDSEDFTITDDDTPSTDLVVVLSQPSALESAGTATVDVTVSLDAGTRTSDTEVRLTVLDDEATSPADYSVTGSPFTLTIDAGDQSVTQPVPIVIVDDNIAEGDETLSIGAEATGLNSDSEDFTITDDDTPSTDLVVVLSQPSALESAGTATVDVTVSLDAGTRTSDTEVRLTVLDDEATSPADYSVTGSPFTLTIDAGDQSVTQPVPIVIVDDNIAEGDETLSIGAEATGLNSDSEDFTITDDDTPSTDLVVVLSQPSALESAGTATVDVTVSLDAGTRTSDTEVRLTVLDDEATSPADYSVTGSPFTLTIDAGDQSVTQPVPIVIVDDNIAEGDETLSIGAEATGLNSDSEDFTITDDDTPSTDLVVVLSQPSALESAGTATVDVTVSLDAGTRTSDTEVRLTVLDDEATSPADYSVTGSPFTLTIDAGDQSVTQPVPIVIVDDNIAEGDETLSIGAEATGLNSDSEDFTITDDDTPSTDLVVVLSQPSALESAGTATVDVTVSLDAGTRTSDTEVRLTVLDDEATSPADYSVTGSPFTLTIDAGDQSVTQPVPIVIVDDNIAEGDETLSIGAEATGLNSDSEDFTITDDDTPSTDLVVVLSQPSALESAGTATVDVTVSLDAGTRTSDTEVRLTVLDDEATSPADYSVTGSPFTLTIDAGDQSVTQPVPIVIVDDNIAEGDETLSIGAEATGLNSDSEDFTIEDDDTSLSITLGVSPSSVAEDAGSTSVTVTATVDGDTFTDPQTVMVSVGTSSDSAVEGTDYAVVDDFEIVIPAGDASVTGTFPLAPMDDAFAEGEETVTVSGLLSGVTVTATELTITDDDATSTALVLTISPESGEEDAGTVGVGVTVRLDAGARTTDTNITLAVLDGTATSPGDYSVSSSPVTLQIPIGMTEVTGTVPIAIVNDDIAEGDETVTLRAEATGLSNDSEDFTIEDDDTPSTDLVVVLSQPSALESAGTATVDVTVSLDAGTRTSDTEVRLTVLDDEATSPADYSVTGSPFTLTIDAGDQSVTQPVPIVIVDDNIAEGDETLSIGAEATGLNSDSEDFTITDDDTPSTDLVVVLSQPSALESAGTATVDVTVSLDAGTRTSDTEVRLTVLDDEATSPADYSVTGSPFTLTIDAGDQSVTQPVPIVIVDDNIAEGDETLSIGAEATGLNSDSEDFTIEDDDTSLSITLGVSPSSVAEDAGSTSVTVTATVDGDTFTDPQTVMVSVGTSSDSAVEGTDYAVVDDFEIVIPAGDASVTGTFPLAPMDDAFAEGEETVTVSGLLSGVTVTATELTITDDDATSTALVLTISPESGEEDAGTVGVGVTVRLDAGARTTDTNITLAVLDGTATSPGDYSVSSSPVTLQIPIGMTEVTGTVPIAIVNDDIAEGDETVTLRAEATGLSNDSEDFTIEDDDTPSTDLVVVLSQPSALESAGTATVDVTVSLDAGTRTSDTEVTLTVLDDEATSPADYSVTGSPFTLTIDAGDQSVTQPVPIVIVDDNIAEGDETLSIGAEATGLNSDSEDFTITDDDTPSTDLVVVLSQPSALESAGTATVDVTVSLDAGTRTSDTEVRLTVLDDEATSPADYSVTGSPFTLTIDAGDQSVTQPVPIVIVDDNIAEGDETLSIGAEATGLNSDSEDFTITDDDTPSTDLVVVLSQPSALESAGTATVDVTVSLDAGTRTSDTEVRLTVLDDEATSPADYSVTGSPFTLTIDAGDQSVTQPVPIVIVDDNIAEGDETLSIGAEATGLNSDSEDFTIEDDDTSLSITLGVSPSSVAEDAGSTSVTVTATVDGDTFTDPQTVMVSVGTSSDSAVEGTDYAVVDDFEIVIPAGDASVTGTFPLAPMDDAFAEGEETVTVSGLLSGVTVTATELTITDDDATSTALVLTISPESGEEDAGTVGVGVTVRLDAGARTTDTNITLAVLDGTATSPGDYSVSSSPVTLQIPIGMTEVTGTVPIAIVNDDIAEGDETVTLRAEATGLSNDSEDFTITDDDTPSTDLVVVLSQPSALESAGTATVDVTVSLDAGTRTSDTEVTLTVLDDEATSPADYSVTGSPFTLTIDAGDQSVTQPVPIVIVDDNIAEGDETLSIGAEATGLNSDSEDFTIEDDDTPSTDLVVVLSQPSALESAGTATVDVTVSLDAGTRTSDTEVTLTVLDDEATSPADYSVTGSPFTLTIDAGDQSVTQPVPIVIVDDNIAEGDETLSIGAEATGLNSDSEDFTITDDDTPSTDLVVVLSQPSALESAGTATVDVTVSLDAGTRTSDTEVRLTVLDDEATSPADYSVTGSPFTLTIDAGDQSVTQPVPIVIVDDNIAEGDETLSIGAEATGLNSDSEDFTIEDDDTSLSITLGVSPSSVAEDAGSTSVTVTATVDGDTFTDPQTVMVSVGTSSDSAVEGTDYAVVDDFEIVIPAGDASVTGTFPLAPMDDAFAEGEETVTVSGLLSGVTVTATELTITDDDATSTALVLTISPESGEEDAGTVGVGVTVRLDAGARTTDTNITLAVLDGTATSPGDYSVSSSPVTLQIPIGMTEVTGTVPIAIVNDDIAEGDETVTLRAEATGLSNDSEDFTIEDDDTSLSVTLGVSPSSVAEDVGTAPVVTVTATVDGGTFTDPQTVMVSVGTFSDSAVEGTDYAVVDDFGIVIPAGDASAMGTFTLAPVDDEISEGEETVTISGLLSGVTVTATELTITDDDAASTALVLTISPDSGVEDAGTVDVGVTVRLDAGARTTDTDITLTVLDGTATSPGDYSASSSPVTLQIPMGMTEVTGTVPIVIVNDDIAEGDETVTIRAEATGLSSDSEDFTIEDDDTSLSITLGVSPSSVAEDVGTAPVVTVTATVDGDTFTDPQTVMVSVGTSGDSAVEGTDYAVVDDFAIVIPAGDASATGTFTLAPVDDEISEGEETLTVSGLLSGVTVAATELTITDDDAASTALVLTVGTARLREDSGTSWARFRVSLNGAARPMDTPMDISVMGGTATAGTDYSMSVIPTLLTIPAGETSIGDSLQITITDDDTVEGDETIVIGVSVAGLTGATQDLVIVDDETAVRIDVLNVIAKDDGDYTITATVRQNVGAPVASVVLYHGDGVTFEEMPMQALVMGSSLYRAELMGPDEGGILYYYVVATNEDGLTSTYPPDGRYWDINDYIEGSRLVLLDFEDGDASDKSDVRHYVAYKGGAGALAEGVLALDGLDDHAEILGSSLGASEEFTLELMFNADDFDAGTLEGNGRYLAVKPAGCATCWGEPTFSLLWGDDGKPGTYVAARFWNRRYEAEQVGLEVPLPLVAGQWYHAVLEVQRDGAERRAVLQLRDTSGLLYGRDTAVLPVAPTISRYPIFVGHIGDRGFFDGRIDNVAFYNYAHFSMLTSGVENVREVPEGYVLEQNYPNPFNPVTTIRYGLATVGHVRLEVSDLLGRRVAVLVDEVQQAGVQEVRFDAFGLSSGMYLYRLEAGDFVSVKKMVLVR